MDDDLCQTPGSNMSDHSKLVEQARAYHPGSMHRVDVILTRLADAVEELQQERDAYRQAKAENDERFMLERDEARAYAKTLEIGIRWQIASTNDPETERMLRELLEKPTQTPRAENDRQSQLGCCFKCEEQAIRQLPMPEQLWASRTFAPCACGNKRCPRSNDHRNACTNSNEPGQPGSAWENVRPNDRENS